MPRVAIALGSNLGDRHAHLAAAKQEIAGSIGEIVAESAIYETAPVGGPEQGPYLNAVVVVDSDLEPRVVLERALAIERMRGRERIERWAARTLDIDIVLYGFETIDEPGLTVPHPHLQERRFVLEPLVDAWPDAQLPDGTAVASLLPGVADQEVTKLPATDRGEPPFELGPRESIIVFVTVGLIAAAMWWLLGYVL